MAQKQHEMKYVITAESNGFSSGLKAAQGALSETQQKLAALTQAQADISAYEKQQRAIETTKQKLELLESQYNNYQREMDETGQFSAKLANQQDKVIQKYNEADDKLREQETTLREMGQSLSDAGIDTENLSSESDRLESEVSELTQQEQEASRAAEQLGDGAEMASDELDETADSAEEAGESSKDFGQQASTAITDVSAMLVSAGIVSKLHDIYDAFMECASAAGDFQEAMSNVEALSGATEQEVTELTAAAKELGATTKYTAEESATAMGYMAMAGWDAQDMLSGIDAVMNLAAASGEDLATVSDIVTDSLTAFGLTAEDTGHFADVLAATATNANTNVSAMGETFKQAAPLAGTLGYSIEDVAVAIGLMANNGIKGSNAGTALKNMFTNLIDSCTLTAKSFGEVKFSAVNADGTMKSWSQTIQELRSWFSQMTQAEQLQNAEALVGTRAMSGFAAIMNTTEDDMASLTASINDCTGAAQEMADIKLDNLNGQLVLMQSAWDGVKIAIGDSLSGELGQVYDLLAQVFSAVTEFVEANPAVVKAIASLAAGIGSATAALAAFGAAKKALSILDLASVFTSPLGAITLAAGAVTGLVGAFEVLLDTVEDGGESYATAALRITDSVEDINTAVREQQAAYKEAQNDALNSAESNDTLVGTLFDLVGAYNGSAGAAVEINNVIDQLNSAVPDLNLAFDDQTGSLNMTADAVEELVAQYEAYNNLVAAMENRDALKQSWEDAKQAAADATAAYEAACSELDVMNAEIENGGQVDGTIYNNLVDNVNQLESAMNASEDSAVNAWHAYYDAYEETEQLKDGYDDLVEAEESATTATKTATSATELSGKKLWQLQLAAEAVSEGYMDAATAAQMYGLDTDELSDYMEEQTSHAEDVAGAVAAVENGYLNAESAADAFGITLDEVNDGLKASYLDDVTAATQNLAEAYDTAYNAAYDSFTGQFELWDKVDKTSATSLSSLQEAVDSQLSYWETYNSNLQIIATSGIDVSGIWDHISDGSEEAASAAQGLADAINSGNTEGVEAYVESYANLQEQIGETSNTAALGTEEVRTAYTELQTVISEGVAGLDLTDEAMTAASNTIQGYVDGLDSSNTVSDWMTTNGGLWLSAMQTALGEHSPSTITDQFGVDTIQGYINGVESMTGTVNSTMTSAANGAVNAFQAAMSQSKFYQFGVDAMQGAINGIKSMQSSLVAAASAAGTAAANAYKAAQDINSPSKLFAWFSEMDIQGAIQGLEKNQEKANRAFEAAAESGIEAYQAASRDMVELSPYGDAVLDYGTFQANALASQAVQEIGSEARSMAQPAEATETTPYDSERIIITLAPVFNIQGVSDSNDIRDALNDFTTDELREIALEAVREAAVDSVRKGYL